MDPFHCGFFGLYRSQHLSGQQVQCCSLSPRIVATFAPHPTLRATFSPRSGEKEHLNHAPRAAGRREHLNHAPRVGEKEHFIHIVSATRLPADLATNRAAKIATSRIIQNSSNSVKHSITLWLQHCGRFRRHRTGTHLKDRKPHESQYCRGSRDAPPARSATAGP